MMSKTPLNIGYFIHGRGRGHASRSLPIARRLATVGHRVTVHGGGDAQDLLGEVAEWQSRAPLLPGPGIAARLPARIVADGRAFLRARPDRVVSDGDQAVLVSAHSLGIPTIALGHDLVFTCCELPGPLSRQAMRYEWANAALSTYFAQQRVAVHFLPVEPKRKGTWVARPDGSRDTTPANEGHIVAYFRDANGAQVVDWLRAQGHDVRWFGPGATAADGTPRPFVERGQFQRELRTASAVVGSAGSNLLAECVLHSKPILALHRQEDTEQELNASLAVTANVAMAATFDSVDAELVERFTLRVQAQEFAKVSLAKHLRPVSDVVEEIVAAR